MHITDLVAWCGIKFGSDHSNPLCYAKHLYLNGESVTKLTVPDGMTRIGSYVFSGCTGLTYVAIPDSVTSIGGLAFFGCTSLRTIRYGGTVAQWEAIFKYPRWANGTGNFTVYCSDGTITKGNA